MYEKVHRVVKGSESAGNGRCVESRGSAESVTGAKERKLAERLAIIGAVIKPVRTALSELQMQQKIAAVPENGKKLKVSKDVTLCTPSEKKRPNLTSAVAAASVETANRPTQSSQESSPRELGRLTLAPEQVERFSRPSAHSPKTF